MEQYKITLTGASNLLMHQDNLVYSEGVEAWRKDPANKKIKANGDDRSPAWTWIGYLYHDGRVLGVNSDCIMTMLREGGAKVSSGGKGTYKKQTQSGIVLDDQQFDLYIDGKTIPIEPISAMRGNNDFNQHLDLAKELGFELLVKRAKIGTAKHVRVRPMFRDWVLTGSLTVINSEITGLTQNVLETVLTQAGALCGLCDWRPGSPSSGSFGKFKSLVERIG